LCKREEKKMIKIPEFVAKFGSVSKGTLITRADKDILTSAAEVALTEAMAAEVEAREAAIAAEAEARDEAIAAAALASQTWLPAVETKAELANPSTLTSTVNYLCRVINDADTPANNGVWQLIAGAEEWVYFSNNSDFVDAAALDAAVDAAVTVEEAARKAADAAEVTARNAAISSAVNAEAEARDEAIAAAALASQTWLPAVGTKAELANPSTLAPTVNYLCRVINDADTPANNGVWQLIAGAADWTRFSDNLDFIDEAELAAVIAAEAEARNAATSAVNAEAEARDEAIAAAALASQTWLPAVGTKAELANPSTLTSTVNYLCRVINDADTPANNGVWQLIAGAEEWAYFSNNSDFADAAAIEAAIAAEAEARDEAIAAALDGYKPFESGVWVDMD
jgi:tetrahydromethanopterin S-methyltransferase subunit E